MPVISGMMRVALAQYALVSVVAALFALFADGDAAISALLGGLSYALPTTLYAVSIEFMCRHIRHATLNAMAVLVGEFVKILVALLLMLLSVLIFENINWPAFLVSLIAVVNSYFVVLFKKH